MAILIATLTFGITSEAKQIRIYRFDLDIAAGAKGDTARFSRALNNAPSLYYTFIDPLISDDSLSPCDKLATFADLKNIIFFYDAVSEKFADISDLRLKMTVISDKMEATLKIPMPDIITFITPYNQSIILLDNTTIAVGLNHYLGADYPPYNYYPSYIKNFKTPEKLPYNIAEAVIRSFFPYYEKEGNLGEHMAYEGAIAVALKAIMPDYDALTAYNFSNDQMNWLLAHERDAQSKLHPLLRSNDPATIRDVTGIVPFCNAVGPQSPGGIGKWLGHKAVETYLKRNGIDIYTFLTNKFYQQWLQKYSDL